MPAKVIEHPTLTIMRVENQRDLAVDALSELYQAYLLSEVNEAGRPRRLNAALNQADRVLRAILEVPR